MTSAALVAGVVLTVADGQSPVMAQSVLPAEPSRINLTQQDLEFIMGQILIAEAHPDGNGTLCVAPDKLTNPFACPTEVLQDTLPFGLRQTNGQNNNLIPENALYGAADQTFPRLTAPTYLQADTTPDMDGPGPMTGGAPTSYDQNSGMVFDAEPRMISNLIADQTEHNPAAASAAAQTEGHGFGASTVQVDHDRDPLTPTITQYVIPNVAPDAGFSASYNSLFTMFGQFFDHGLDLAAKGGSGTVFVPLQPDDPLYDPTSQTNFMVLTRATNQPGDDGVLGTADDVKDATNMVTPYIDNNQTYTSHPSHQVFLREYGDTGSGAFSTGLLLDGAAGGLPTWNDVKTQALEKLGIELQDTDVLNVPLVATDAYGKFLLGPNGYPQLVLNTNELMEGDPAQPVSTADLGSSLVRTGHAFLDDIAHHAAPGTFDHDHNPATPGLPMLADVDPGTTDDHDPTTYDDEMLGAHFITGDGRGNENIGLTAMHHVFHEEHNGLVGQLEQLIPTLPVSSPASLANWTLPNGEWNGERLFQAAKFVNEMEYQHIVFGEFARAIQPAVNLFAGYDPSANPAITAEFAHAVYRFGHSMLTETVARTNTDGTTNDISLMDAFLNPLAFTDGGSAGQLSAAAGAGAIIRGMVNQRGEEIDEFVTEALRNNLVGLPLDLATLNLTRARSEGIAPLNEVRRQLYNGTVVGASGSTILRPYTDWNDFGMSLRHAGSLVNFVAAYGTHPSITSETTLEGKRAAAQLIVEGVDGAPTDAQDFMDGTGAWLNVGGRSVTGLEDVDLWIGGLAEAPPLFGGMLGSTFNFVFEHQMEALQANDRMYYLARTEGLPLLAELEVNTFSDLIRRTTDASNVPVMAFTRSDYTFDLSAQTNPTSIIDDPNTPYNETNLDGWAKLQRANGGIRLRGAGSSLTENHSTWLGTNGNDKVTSAEGDDSLWGNDGDDTLEGGIGADMIEGGAGNDVLTDSFGDDIIAGGDGHDVVHGGTGLDILTGDNGDDAIFHGSDDKESFAGAGDDVVVGGGGADAAAGGPGQDWLEGGPASDFLVGDERPAFALLTGEDDVLVGGSGDDRYLAEGGMDIMVIGGGGVDSSNGGLGFDFATYSQSAVPAFGDLTLPPLAVGGVANPRDRFTLTEGISGGPSDDTLRGDDRVRAVGHELTEDSMAKVTGLETLLRDGDMLNPPGSPSMFTGDDIVIGGDGSDMLEGGGGADLIDGDASLEVQLVCTEKTTQSPIGVNSASLVQTLFFDRSIEPNACDIDRSIQYPAPSGAIDTAVYRFPQAEYFVGLTPDGKVTVSHLPANGGGGGADDGGGGGAQNEGTDILLNIEQIQFADGTISVTPADINSPVSGIVSIDVQNPIVGDTLNATPTVVDPDGIDLTTEGYTWEALTGVDPFFGTDIWEFIGAGPSLLVEPAQLGQPIRVVYSFFDVPGNFESVISDPTAPVVAGGVLPIPVLALTVDPVTDPTNIPVSALFTKPVNGLDVPIADAQVVFDLNGTTQTAFTDANGVASTVFSITDVPGTELTFSAQAIDPADPNLTIIDAPQVFLVAEYAGVGLVAVDTVDEAGSGTTTPLTATIALDAAVTTDVTVDWVATSVDATEGTDYVGVGGTATILAGTTEAIISVDVVGDELVEADETIDFAITGVTGGIVTGAAALTGTITNDDQPTIVAGADQVAVEADANGVANSITFEVTLDQPAFEPVSIDWTLLSGTATAGVDFTDSTGTVAFLPGETVAFVTVALVDDAEVELDEQFTLELDPLTVFGANAPLTTSITGTIVDNDIPVVIAGPNVSVLEGGRNARTPLNFSLQLDQPSPNTVSVSWTLGGGTARAGTDYVRGTGTATFAPGEVSKIVTATVIGDTTAEANETLNLTITGVTNALVGQQSATGTILDDDTPASAVINDVSITEGDTGTKTASFTITLSKAPTASVSVLAEVAAGTARIPSDVRALRTTVTIPAGQLTATVNVTIVGDRTREPNETYTVRLSRATGITLADSSGRGTIVNDD
ncbi:MAG: heme peroxidase [Actinobacteria bacterium]|nr:heme peroxidase [Actinomycetota bacterium]